MAQIRVTATQLRAAANDLRQKNVNFRNEVMGLENVEGALNGMWDGDANTAFHNAFTTDKSKMEQFARAIDQYVQVLEDIAQKYELAENRSTDIAGTRSY